MDSAAYFESDEHLRRQILLLLVDEEEGLKDTAPTCAAFGQLRLPIEILLGFSIVVGHKTGVHLVNRIWKPIELLKTHEKKPNSQGQMQSPAPPSNTYKASSGRYGSRIL
ncbi:hypothetical protein QJS10_CPA08g00508 [Acorus calamus]|uniref:Uncharacterized protein n=1 Tax=Acorus calamus TaxID=4465 RepID=A0AAV9ECT0_ACOCL|nr:hypothetical protein QJS10_CPA08g00508 [Acorus calamus]